MIFAHGPAGLLAAYIYRKYNKQVKFPDKQIVYLFVISFIGGIIPDIDLFYYYFVSAEISHRQLPTHSLLIWIIIFLIIYFSAKLLKNNFIKIAGIFFFLGNLSHLLCDTLYAGVMLFYPFSTKLIGIQYIPFISGDFYSNNILLVNYSLESLIITIFCIIILKYIIHSKKIIKILQISLVFSWILILSFLIFLNLNVFNVSVNKFFKDIDNDSLINGKDFDVDGDGIFNIEDPDINGDNISNSVEFDQTVARSLGTFYDLTNEGFLEIPLRMGLQTNTSFITDFYLDLNINVREEMLKTHYQNPDNFATTPESAEFNRNYENIFRKPLFF